jgi:transcriptional regulator with XRE-family HTH domain
VHSDRAGKRPWRDGRGGVSGSRPNERLASVMREAGLSRKSLARAVQMQSARQGSEPVACDHTSVSRWLAGTRPRERTARLLAEVFSAQLGRPVSAADIGLAESTEAPHGHGVELDELVAELGASETSGETIGRLEQATHALAEAHSRAPARHVLDQVLRLHGQARSLLGGRQRLSQRRTLYRVESQLLAHASLLLGDLRSDAMADRYGTVALMYAEEAGADEAIARAALAKTLRWQNRLIESAELAANGYAHSPSTPIRIQLAAQEANAAALLGDAERARAAMRRAETDADRVAPDSGLSAWSFGRGRQAVFALSVANQTGDPAGALRAAAMADEGWAAGEAYVPANWAQVRLGAAYAHLALGSLDAAVAEVAPVLDLPPEMRIATVTAYMDTLHRKLSTGRYRDSGAADELRQRIRAFNAGALPDGLPDNLGTDR